MFIYYFCMNRRVHDFLKDQNMLLPGEDIPQDAVADLGRNFADVFVQSTDNVTLLLTLLDVCLLNQQIVFKNCKCEYCEIMGL